MSTQIIILGTGGNCIDILDTIHEINRAQAYPELECIGFLDDAQSKWGSEFYGVKVLGPLDSAHKYGACRFINGIGSPDNFWKRREIIASTGIVTDQFFSIVHPAASVSALAVLGRGAVVFQNATITSNAQIGDHVTILPNSVVSHDVVLGNYSCIAGGACISGEVTIGESCYVGSGAVLKGRVKVGDRCLIGMGSVVLRDVPANSVVVGNPARFLRPTVA